VSRNAHWRVTSICCGSALMALACLSLLEHMDHRRGPIIPGNVVA
jgi:hypothetical protein